MRLSFRTARPDDLERLIDVHSSAFPDPRDRDARARNFTRNALGDLDDLWVAVAPDSAAILGHAFLFSLRAWFGGRLVPVGGIASVGVAPEARRRGVGTALMEHLHAVSLARGDAVALLYPFRQAFYGRLGYAATSTYRRMRVDPASIPWTPLLSARPATGTDRDAMKACWTEAAARHSGMLDRSERLWESRWTDEATAWLVVEGASRIEGYLSWTVQQREPHAATTLVVRELVAATDAAMRSLWGLIGAQRGQVAEAHVDVARDDLIEQALADADGGRFGDARVEHALGEVVAGPMIRILDAARALEARGYAAEGRLALTTGAEELQLTVRDGKGHVASTGSRSQHEADDWPHVRVLPGALAALGFGAFGACPATHAVRLGWLQAKDDRSLALADALLGLPAYFSPDAF
jgi:predicted acetyltransferase